jgi:hypothetical protein
VNRCNLGAGRAEMCGREQRGGVFTAASRIFLYALRNAILRDGHFIDFVWAVCYWRTSHRECGAPRYNQFSIFCAKSLLPAD